MRLLRISRLCHRRECVNLRGNTEKRVTPVGERLTRNLSWILSWTFLQLHLCPFSCRMEFCFHPPPAATGGPRSSSWSVPMHSTPNSRWFYIIDLILSISVIFFFNRALSVANSVNADASLNRGIQTEAIKSRKAPSLRSRCPD